MYLNSVHFGVNKSIDNMSLTLPEISKKIRTEDLINIFERRYSEISPVWIPMQLEWLNEVYKTFYDYDKFMIIIHLIGKTFDFYSKNFVKLNYEEYFNQNQIDIEKINIMEISKTLNIPKETARRKIIELEKLGTIKRKNKKIIVDRSTWPNIKPEDTIRRMSRFLATLSIILHKEKIMLETITSDQISKAAKENFSYVWKLYYEMQMPMLLNFKKEFGDLESFHVWGICIVNQALNSKKNDNSEMSKEYYLDRYIFNLDKKNAGINAMSISDISGIPRATVIRKLHKLIKEKFLQIDDKKQYSATGSIHKEKLIEIQKKNFINLSKFASLIYNLSIN